MKRPADENAPVPDAKRQKFPELRRQVEYYMSDQNLEGDRFFNSKIAENPEGWLDMKFILSCKKIIAMGEVTAEDIIEALQESHLESRAHVDDTTFCAVRRTAPVPQLRQRKPQKDIHGDGCLLTVSGLPEEATWTQVKDALRAKLPEEEKFIRFVSQVTQDGKVNILCNKFEKDRSVLQEISELEACGTTLKVALMRTEEEKKLLWRDLPRFISKTIEKDRVRANREKERQPLLLGGVKFENVDHLKKCLKEVLETTEVGTDFEEESNTAKILKALVQYHPMRYAKAKDLASFKVGTPEKEGAKDCKAFHIVKTDKSSESFSVQKCLQGMIKNPPVDPDAPRPAPKAQSPKGKNKRGSETPKSDATSETPKSQTEGAAAEAETENSEEKVAGENAAENAKAEVPVEADGAEAVEVAAEAEETAAEPAAVEPAEPGKAAETAG